MQVKAVEQLSPLQCRDLLDRRLRQPLPEDSSQRELVILDVRTGREYSLGHIKGSINLDLKSPSFPDQVAELDRSKAYIVYCRTGVRSRRALMLMQSLDFPELYDLVGGIAAWRAEGLEASSD